MPLMQIYRRTRRQIEETTVQDKQPFIYTEDQLMARLKFFIGVCLALTLTGIVFVVLYSLIFVTQPLNAISPIDQKFFELIVPIATFLTGTLSGIMLAGHKKEDQEAMLAAHKQAQVNQESTKAQASITKSSFGGLGSGMPAAPFGGPASTTPFGPLPSTTSPFGDSTDSGEVITGFGGKPAPPPITNFPER